MNKFIKSFISLLINIKEILNNPKIITVFGFWFLVFGFWFLVFGLVFY